MVTLFLGHFRAGPTFLKGQPMIDSDARRYAWLLLKVYGVRRAPQVAESFRDALAAIGDQEHLPTWEQVAQAVDILVRWEVLDDDAAEDVTPRIADVRPRV